MRAYSTKIQSIWLAAWGIGLLLAIMAVFQAFSIIAVNINDQNILLHELILYSAILFSLGAGFGFSSLETNERTLFWKWRFVWLLFIILGVSFNITSIMAYYEMIDANAQTAMDIVWQNFFYISLPLLSYGLIFLFVGMSDQTRERFWKLWPFYILFFLLALVFGFGSIGIFFAGGAQGEEIITDVTWEILIAPAALFCLLSLIPMAYAAGQVPSFKRKIGKLSVFWLLFCLIGFVIYIVSVIDILNLLDDEALIGGAFHREYGVIVGLVIQIPGFVLLFAGLSDSKTELTKKLSFFWLIIILAGLGLAGYSSLYDNEVSTLGLGTVLILFGCGAIYKAISFDYVPQAIGSGFQPVQSGFEDILSGDSISLPDNISIQERTYFLELEARGYENTIHQLRNASKSGKISVNLASNLEVQYNKKIEQLRVNISSMQEQAKRSSRKSIFEEGLGLTSRESVPTRESVSTTSSPRPSEPPTAPAPGRPPGAPSAPGGLPSAPGAPPAPGRPPGAPPAPGGLPSAPSPGRPPGAPPAPGGLPGAPSPGGPPGAPPAPGGLPGAPSPGGPPGPPTPGGPPKPPGTGPPGAPSPGGPPGSPSGEVVGAARSTSIAELRGEMLKELRRLRDIFKEDEVPK
ncbi:MAG: hypothetical protein ACXAC7_00165 [Candidatus Hodarchaeales archaeon]|jgi:hypothetical protein